jgi:acetyl esterase
MTREEMIKQAKETRKQVMRADVSQELLDANPAVVTRRAITTRVGETVVYDTAAEEIWKDAPLIVNLHGGGFIRERTMNDEVFCRRIANALHCRVLDVDYRIAPDYPFPYALYESFDVAAWAWNHAEELGAKKENLVLIGHSAGGNLVCSINLMLKENPVFVPKMNIVDYPPLDLYTDPAAKEKMGDGIPYDRARLYNLYYCEESLLKEPLVSPVYASDEQMKDFPPTLVMTAGTDDLCNEAEEFALRLARQGCEVTLKRFCRSKHGFTIYRTMGCDEAVELIVRFIHHH